MGSTTHLSAKNYTGMFFPHLGDILLIRYFSTSSQQTKFAAGKTSRLFSWYGFVFSLLFLSSVLNFKNEVNTAIEASPKHRVFQSYLVNFDHLCKTEVIYVWCGTGLLGGCECIYNYRRSVSSQIDISNDIFLSFMAIHVFCCLSLFPF